ncbi:hypothetical protein KPN8_62 [Klebsiella phage KPN8]|nr:hypothetical protein KPN8_62 [Klebsiella phage KPN8]
MTYNEVEKYLEMGEAVSRRSWKANEAVYLEPTTLLNPAHYPECLKAAGINSLLRVDRHLVRVTASNTVERFIPNFVERNENDWYVKSYTFEQNKALPEHNQAQEVA